MKEQDENDNLSKFAARLSEERRRVHPHQGDFARSIGSTQGKQSLFERGERALRASYLERVAEAGLDVGFIITGLRSSSLLAVDESELLDGFRRLSRDDRDALLRVARAMSGGRPAVASVHAGREAYRSE